MKTNRIYLVSSGLAFALAVNVFGQDAPKPETPPVAPVAPVAPAENAKPAAVPPPAPKAAPKAGVVVKAPAAPAAKGKTKEPELRLNFRGAPLDMVLNYLSEAAGFIVVLDAPARGTVDVWSNTPVTKTEAVELLNSVLSKNGLAAIQNGRTLTIVSKEDAKKRDIPVKSGNNPELIPKNDEIVTQIIPVRYINAAQATKDLAPLLPTSATITANEAGNSLVITDSQSSIRRVAEIISALDNAVSGTATIKVFPLKYADAKTLAATIKELFSGEGRGGSRDPRSAIASFIASRFGGGGAPPGFPGGPGGDPSGGRSSRSGSSGGGGGAANANLVAVADEYSNSLIVSAPDEMITSVEELIKQVDQPVEDVSELRVFHLKNADPNEMADLLTQLFPDPTATSRTSSRSSSGFPSPFPGFDPSRNRSGSSDTSDRAKKQSKVTAVADARTSSLIVTASRDVMPQISEMVLQLDSSNAKKQKVFVYSLENADVQQVEEVLRDLFESQNRRSPASSQNRNALDTRANNAAQTQGTPTSGFGAGGQGGVAPGIGR